MILRERSLTDIIKNEDRGNRSLCPQSNAKLGAIRITSLGFKGVL